MPANIEKTTAETQRAQKKNRKGAKAAKKHSIDKTPQHYTVL
jgi:hypothetical protein